MKWKRLDKSIFELKGDVSLSIAPISLSTLFHLLNKKSRSLIERSAFYKLFISYYWQISLPSLENAHYF
jgi:hypothetical protein